MPSASGSSGSPPDKPCGWPIPAIRVNRIAPGHVDTAMHRAALAVQAEARGASTEKLRRAGWNRIPMGRPPDIAGIAAAMHVVSTAAARSFVGATLDAKGGCRFT